MLDSLNYWHEKILVGVDIMITGNSLLAKRLEDAWISSLIRMQIHNDVPDDLKRQYASIKERMAPGDQVAKDALSAMTDTAKSELASDIHKLYVDVMLTQAERRQ